MKRKPTIRVATKCRHADRYKAMNPPRCGCDLCRIKWAIAESNRRINALIDEVVRKADRGIDPVTGEY